MSNLIIGVGAAKRGKIGLVDTALGKRSIWDAINGEMIKISKFMNRVQALESECHRNASRSVQDDVAKGF